MSYRIRTDVFEGPFDLLLHLVSRQKLDVNSISITEVADQYLEHIDRMRELDLDVASDFLLLAATLLEIKAASLLPKEEQYFGDELDDMSPQEARELLVARLLAYKQFKNVAAELAARMESVGRMHPRQAGIEQEFLGLMPDYLEDVTLRGLAVVCADLMHKRAVFLLEAEHVASMPISLEKHADSVARTLKSAGSISFAELIGDQPNAELIVVTFLAILELYKRGLASLSQTDVFAEIVLTSRTPDYDDVE
ncbi:MAG: segregation/condensation protein A [Actinomycetota bacterium]|jgi:segregation and condensation protein A|nr:segregation/condensation protein A [Actinomycetota bacterium]